MRTPVRLRQRRGRRALSLSWWRRYIALSDALYALVAATPAFEPLDDLSRSFIETGSYPASAIPLIERVADIQSWHMQSHSRLDQAATR